MKQLSRHMVFLLSILYPTLLCMAQQPSAAKYRDSLYHSISRDGYARQEFRLSYTLKSSDIFSGLGNNSMELSRLASFVHSVMAYPEQDIERIRLTGYSSVDGYYVTNDGLARDRAYSLLRYLQIHFPELMHYPFDVAWIAEDWDGLAQLVKESHLNERFEVLEIIHKIPVFDGRESLLMSLNGGRAYREMEQAMFPLLRRVEMVVEYSSCTQQIADKIAQGVINRISTHMDTLIHHSPPDSLVVVHTTMNGTTNTEKRKQSDRRIFALKTNLLSWTGVMPDFTHTTSLGNMALEYYITPRWSVEIGAIYSYWKYNNDRDFQGISGYRIEPRWWVPVFPGAINMYLGAYARLGDYDIRQTKNEEEDNYTGRYRDVGISAGVYIYLTPAWGIELGARSGYVHSFATKYIHQDMANWRSGRKGYYRIRMTDLNVSLVYRFR